MLAAYTVLSATFPFLFRMFPCRRSPLPYISCCTALSRAFPTIYAGYYHALFDAGRGFSSIFYLLIFLFLFFSCSYFITFFHESKCFRPAKKTGFIGIHKYHKNSFLPKKSSKKQPLTNEDKLFNQIISSERVTNEHAIGFVKRFKILSERYRNRRKRFGLRFNLIAGICNFDL